MHSFETPPRMSVATAALRIGVSPHTLRTWLRQRRLPHYRCGRRVVVDGGDLDAFMRAGRVEAAAEAASPVSVGQGAVPVSGSAEGPEDAA